MITKAQVDIRLSEEATCKVVSTAIIHGFSCDATESGVWTPKDRKAAIRWLAEFLIVKLLEGKIEIK